MSFVYFSGGQSYLAQASCPVLHLSERANIPNADSIERDRQLCPCVMAARHVVYVCQAPGVQGEQHRTGQDRTGRLGD